MIDWLRGLFFRKPLSPKKVTPPSTPAPAVLHVSKPIPASLNVDYQDQMRKQGGGLLRQRQIPSYCGIWSTGAT